MPAGGHGRDRLSPVQRRVAAICDLRQEINAGGFDAYFRYWGGNTAQEALAAIGKALGPDWAVLLREAILIFGSDYPINADDRLDRLDAPTVQADLDDIDRRYFELENSLDADGLMSEYLSDS